MEIDQDGVPPTVQELWDRAGSTVALFREHMLVVLYRRLVDADLEAIMLRLWPLVLDALSANKRISDARQDWEQRQRAPHVVVWVEEGFVVSGSDRLGALGAPMLRKVELDCGTVVQEVSASDMPTYALSSCTYRELPTSSLLRSAYGYQSIQPLSRSSCHSRIANLLCNRFSTSMRSCGLLRRTIPKCMVPESEATC